MDDEYTDIGYARTQWREAERRFESVRNRVTKVRETEKKISKPVIGALDTRDDEPEVVVGDEVEEIPEEHRRFVTLGRKKEKEIEEIRNVEGNVQNVIIDCQMSIELSVKAMFKAVGEDFDYSHGINFGSHNTKAFNSAVPSEFPRNDELVRAIFLTQLWEKFYQLAKYGAPELDVGPSVIFETNDGERALNDASFCVKLAEDFIEYVDEHGPDESQ